MSSVSLLLAILGLNMTFVPSADGVIGVEFAMILTVLMLFIFGIITFGWMFYLENTMETAAREAARRMAVAEA